MGDDSNPTTIPSGLPWSEQNWDQFKCFAETMTRHDRMHGPDTFLIFQPIKEANKALDNKKFIPATINHLGEAYDVLSELNDQGYSIHWGLNEYGYMGELPSSRRKQHVSRIRCFAADIDKPITLPLLNKLIEIFYPTCVVLSSCKGLPYENDETDADRLMVRHYHPGKAATLYKVHFYWQIHNQFGTVPQSPSFSKQTNSAEELTLIKNWKLFQNAIAWKIDDTINDLLGLPEDESPHWTDKGLLPVSQTLRVPGFFHIKDPEHPFITCVYYSNTDNVLSVESLPVWLNAISIDAVEIQRCSQLLEDWKHRRSVKYTPHGKKNDNHFEPVNRPDEYMGAGEGGRNESLHQYACQLIFKKKFNHLEALGSCLEANTAKNEPPLEREEVESIVNSAWTEYQRIQSDKMNERLKRGDTSAALAVGETLRDYFTARAQNNNPIGQVLGLTSPNQDSAILGAVENSIDFENASWEQRIDPKIRFLYDYDKFRDSADIVSDISLIDRIKQRFNGGIKVHPSGALWSWDGEEERWVSGDFIPNEMAKRMGVDVIREPKVLETLLKPNGDLDERAYRQLCLSLHSERKITSILKKLKRDASIKMRSEELNPPHHLLNCQNGLLDLTTGGVIPASREYFVTRKAGVVLQRNTESDCADYRFPDARELLAKSRWSKFIYEIMSEDVDMCHYLQKIAGYTLMGGNPLEVMFFFYGCGANGKSLFTGTLAKMFGEYSFTVPSGVFLQGSKDRMSILSQLVGVRLALTSELGYGKSWSEESIKDVTGADDLTVRPLYQQSFNYSPEFKVIVRGNHKPKIHGSDYGVWRRIRPMPFDRIFRPLEVDITLPAVLSTESGLYEVLTWAVGGYQMYLEEGLKPPVRAAEAYVEYRNQTMPILGFIGECFDLAASGIDLGLLEGGGNVVTKSRGNSIHNGESIPMEFADLLDSGKLHRLYVAWWGRRGSQMSEPELFDACNSLGIPIMRIKMITDTQIEKQPKTHTILGLRIKQEWLAKANSGRATFGQQNAATTAAILKSHLQ